MSTGSMKINQRNESLRVGMGVDVTLLSVTHTHTLQSLPFKKRRFYDQHYNVSKSVFRYCERNK